MPIGKEPGTDEPDDRVRIKLGGDADVHIVEEYHFATSILQQPSAFVCRISGGRVGGPASVSARYPPGPTTRVALYVGPYRQFTGEVDAVNARGNAKNGTLVELRGRDMMARLHDQDISAERSWNGATYEELFKAGLQDVGQGDKVVEVSNTANRKVRSGASTKVIKEPVKPGDVKRVPGGKQAGKFHILVTAKLGETWLTFFRRQFGKLGLFPWADANGNFVLSRPNGDQEATYQFKRNGWGNTRRDSNVEEFAFTNDTTLRFSEVATFARNQGRKKGHNHTHGTYEDAEMKALGFNRRHCYRDLEVTDAEEGEFYARRKLAEVNRASWKLVYTVSGHTAPVFGGGGKRAVIVPDTVARVDDEELGIHMNLYVESVEYKSPPRTTVVTMMRPQDLLFGDPEPKKQLAVANAKAAEKKRQVLTISSDSIVTVDHGRTIVSTFDTKVSSKTPDGRTATTTVHRGGK